MTSLSNLINERWFRRLTLLTIILVYLLIAIGGIVRSTGSGMGCPDWPKCFGQWVPPTDVSQLPANYQAIYAHRGYASVEFNVAKTWTEYLNRLLGVLIGIFIFFTFVASTVAYWRSNRALVGYSFLAFILVGVQGWLGAKVVSSVLAAWLITLHMLLAIVIVGILLYVLAKSSAQSLASADRNITDTTKRWLIISSALLLLQILLGTQVREAVDEVAIRLSGQQRFRWIEEIGIRFYIHRSFSIVVSLAQLMWIHPLIAQHSEQNVVRRLAVATLTLIGVEIATGVVMAYMAIPAWAQPVHLTLAVVALGIQFLAILFVNRQALLTPTNRATNEFAQ